MGPTAEVVNENEFTQAVSTITTKITDIRVTNDVELSDAAQLLRDVNVHLKKVEEWFEPMIDQAFKAHRAICAKKNKYVNPLKAAKEFISKTMGTYQLEQDRKREEEEAKAREEARKKEEADRKKLLNQAAKAEANGNTEKAEELLQKAEDVYVPPAPVQSVTAKPQGTSTRWTWDAEVANKALVPDDYKIVDTARLSKMATAAKGDFIVPGVRFVKRAIVSGRA